MTNVCEVTLKPETDVHSVVWVSITGHVIHVSSQDAMNGSGEENQVVVCSPASYCVYEPHSLLPFACSWTLRLVKRKALNAEISSNLLHFSHLQ